MTRGLHHVTDPSNASRTLLYDLRHRRLEPPSCSSSSACPGDALPDIVSSYGVIGHTDPASFLGLDLPIAAILGDQQAALFGQGCFTTGSSKCTYGTGSFVLVNTGEEIVASHSGLLTTVAWQHPDGRREYALEGAVFVTGAAVQWLRDGLGIISAAAETEDLARSVPDSGGVVFVPALTGLGAPDWDPYARGAILGITRGTTRAHLVRATLEAIAFEVRDVVDLMTREAGVTLPDLSVDGGAAANELPLPGPGRPARVSRCVRSAELQATGLGAGIARRAGHGRVGLDRRARRAAAAAADARFDPASRDDPQAHRRWRIAVERAKGWAQRGSGTLRAPRRAGRLAGRAAAAASTARRPAPATGCDVPYTPMQLLGLVRVDVHVLLAGQLHQLVHDLVGHAAQHEPVILHALVPGEVQGLADLDGQRIEVGDLLAGGLDLVGADHRDRDHRRRSRQGHPGRTGAPR